MSLLSIPTGATWKYLTDTGPSSLAWPRFVGFGLDSPPSDTTFAQPGYDDSAWADGQTVFHNNTWVEDFGPPDPLAGGTIYGGVVHDGNDKIWARTTGRSHGGDLRLVGVHDNFGAFYVDGCLIASGAGSGVFFDLLVPGALGGRAGPYPGTALPGPLTPGLHTFAFYGSGDGGFDQHGLAVTEQPFVRPALRQFPRDDALGNAPRPRREATSVQASARQGWSGTYR